MCGIAGLVGARPVDRATVAAMTDLLAHRGPDDSGLWSSADARCVLGHRRLSIIDPTPAGHQPMISGAHVVTFNGEIYNYLELAERLKREGEHFQTSSDTEILLAAYRRWGEKCVCEFNGMFAFAIYDADRRVLFCARDRFGEKPFLFRAGNEFFAFASEYKALLRIERTIDRIDDVRLARFLFHPSQGLDDGINTVFPGIMQLPPAHTLTLDLDRLTWRIARYWDVRRDASAAALSEMDAQRRFRELLTDSVKLRLRSDVPQGSCLSGGLDSSAVVCIARELLGDDTPYDTFTGRFPGSNADEGEWADEVVRAAHTRSHIAEPTPEGLLAEIADFAWHNELPTGSASQYAQWSVFRLAKETGITVLLDGQGADELLGGYEQYFGPYLASLAPQDQATERAKIAARYPLGLASTRERLSRSLPRRVAHGLAGAMNAGSDAAFGLAWPVAERMYHALPKPGAAPDFHPLGAALHRDMLSATLPVLLRYGDRNSMAHSREVRLPFCDHRLAEFVFSLPPAYLMGGAETKRLLRGALSGVLPEKIRTRWNKQGFVPPQVDWFRGSLGPAIRAIIEDPSFRDSTFWRARWWRSALDRFQKGETALASVLWRPFMEHAWRTHFVERIGREPALPVFAVTTR
jgi:asparagine synthase (glutamine-hydrolysing)